MESSVIETLLKEKDLLIRNIQKDQNKVQPTKKKETTQDTVKKQQPKKPIYL